MNTREQSIKHGYSKTMNELSKYRSGSQLKTSELGLVLHIRPIGQAKKS